MAANVQRRYVKTTLKGIINNTTGKKQLSSFHLNGHTYGFRPQDSKLRTTLCNTINSTTGKNCSVAFIWMVILSHFTESCDIIYYRINIAIDGKSCFHWDFLYTEARKTSLRVAAQSTTHWVFSCGIKIYGLCQSAIEQSQKWTRFEKWDWST